MLVVGFAGDEFVWSCRIAAGGEDEDTVGFGLG
jgi:hypothetical protein